MVLDAFALFWLEQHQPSQQKESGLCLDQDDIQKGLIYIIPNKRSTVEMFLYVYGLFLNVHQRVKMGITLKKPLYQGAFYFQPSI